MAFFIKINSRRNNRQHQSFLNTKVWILGQIAPIIATFPKGLKKYQIYITLLEGKKVEKVPSSIGTIWGQIQLFGWLWSNVHDIRGQKIWKMPSIIGAIWGKIQLSDELKCVFWNTSFEKTHSNSPLKIQKSAFFLDFFQKSMLKI